MQQEARGGTIAPQQTFLSACRAVHDVPVSSKNHIRNAKAFCECKKFYSEDFEARFTRSIAQPREFATDPNWPRLHPAIPRCQQ
jgi:hypothetical protein